MMSDGSIEWKMIATTDDELKAIQIDPKEVEYI